MKPERVTSPATWPEFLAENGWSENPLALKIAAAFPDPPLPRPPEVLQMLQAMEENIRRKGSLAQKGIWSKSHIRKALAAFRRHEYSDYDSLRDAGVDRRTAETQRRDTTLGVAELAEVLFRAKHESKNSAKRWLRSVGQPSDSNDIRRALRLIEIHPKKNEIERLAAQLAAKKDTTHD